MKLVLVDGHFVVQVGTFYAYVVDNDLIFDIENVDYYGLARCRDVDDVRALVARDMRTHSHKFSIKDKVVSTEYPSIHGRVINYYDGGVLVSTDDFSVFLFDEKHLALIEEPEREE